MVSSNAFLSIFIAFIMKAGNHNSFHLKSLENTGKIRKPKLSSCQYAGVYGSYWHDQTIDQSLFVSTGMTAD